MSNPQNPQHPYGRPESGPLGSTRTDQALNGPQGPGADDAHADSAEPFSSAAAEPRELDDSARCQDAPPGPDSPPRQLYPGFPDPPHRSATPEAVSSRNRQGMILTVVVASVALSLGGYFLVSSKGDSVLVASSSSSQAEQVTGGATGAPPAQSAPMAPEAAAGTAAGAPSGAVVTFTPPSDYNSNSLVNDPGCIDYNNATDASSAAIGDQPTATQAVTALTALGAALHTAAHHAQDPTLAAALAAEAAFVEQDQATLVTALVSGDSDTEVAAYQPIENTDDFVSAVCGTDQSPEATSD